MLAVLLEIPQDQDGWSRFAFHNQQQIDLINQAILARYGITLPVYILFPIDVNSPTQWLQNNQAAHADFNGVLGFQSHNIQDLDLTDPDDVADWINLNYGEMRDASEALAI